jgi:hypothetical protein
MMTAPKATRVKAEEVNWAGVGSVLDPVIAYDPAEPQALRRTVLLLTKQDEHIEFEEPVWPIWVPTPDSETTVADFEKQWADASAQARSTAKWIATVLGAALAALIGSAPLANLRDLYVPRLAYLYGGVGLVLVALTLFLVLRVLVPRVTGFDDLTSGGRSFRTLGGRWFRKLRGRSFRELKARLEGHGGVLLPTGISSFDELACRAQLEERTLNQLAILLTQVKHPDSAISKERGAASSLLHRSKKPDADTNEQRYATLAAAQAGRAQWLTYLTETITQWTAVASYQDVADRAGLARGVGLISGTVGTALIVVSFLMPTVKTPTANLATYRIANDGVAAAAAQSAIGGAHCAKFKGIVVGRDAQDNVTILVQPDAGCDAASITIPGTDLVQIAGG